MTEAEWLTGSDPSSMLKVVRSPPKRRKLRLFACACCRRLGPLLPQRSQDGVDVAERFADDFSTRPELDAAHARAQAAVLELPRVWSDDVLALRYATTSAAECISLSAATIPGAISIAAAVARAVALSATTNAAANARELAGGAELSAQAELARDIFGNPFRPVAYPSEWRTETVLTLARMAYADREFSAMPILADALQDAGCENPGMLDHCRGPSPHVRGCWVLDLILDKG